MYFFPSSYSYLVKYFLLVICFASNTVQQAILRNHTVAMDSQWQLFCFIPLHFSK